jgi:hypothetical protein
MILGDKPLISEVVLSQHQAPGGIHHLLLSYVYTKEVWFRSLRRPGLHRFYADA